jgi:hypothetical protein
MDAVSDVAGRAAEAVSGAAGAAGEAAGRAGRAVGVVPAVAAVLGGLAATVGGWWLNRSSGEAELGEEDETHYRTHFESHPARSSGLTYEHARTGYALGHVASRNPGYSGRSYDEVEPELRGGFTGEHAGSYDSLRDFTRYGYERGRGTGGAGGTGGLGGSSGTGSTGGLGGSGATGSTGLGGSGGSVGGTGAGSL